MSVDTGRGTYKRNALTTYDWESTYTKYLDGSDVNTATNRITWNTHGMRDKYTVIFQTPYQGLTDMGIADGTVFYVKNVDANTIELYTDSSLSSIQSLSALTNLYGMARLSLCYKVEAAAGTARRTPFGVYVNAQSTAVTTNYIGSTSTSTLTTNLALPSSVTASSLSIEYIEICGDTNSSSEYVTVTIGSTTQRIYGGNQSSTYFASRVSPTGSTTTAFHGLDISSLVTGSPGSYSLSIQTSCASSVGGFVSGLSGQRYRIRLRILQAGGTFTDVEKSVSGGDLGDSDWGLGTVKPSNIIAFQGRTPGSYASSADAFSYLSNQRTYGRYGTFAVRNPSYEVQGTSAGLSGSFDINYTDSTTSYGTSSQIYYVFCNTLTADRNTVYIPNHGITGNQDVDVTVDSTRYSAGDRFGYTNLTSGTTDMPANFQATATPVNSDIIRLSTKQAPNTDDITRVPTDFTLDFIIPNETYNSIYVANHKITGDVTATYTNTSGTVIPPLTDGQSVRLQRLDDSRLKLASVGGSQSGTVTPVIERSQNGAYTVFIDLETSLGFTPGTAQVNSLEFRGDFSSSNEYVDLEILNSSNVVQNTYRIGQYDDSGDTSNYTTSTTFPGSGQTYQLGSILHNNGGSALGFTVRVTPNGMSYGPGGGPWWGLRFNISAVSNALVVTGSGSGGHTFDAASVVGAYDGVLTVASVPASNSFTMDGTFKIPIREYEFTSTEVSTASRTINFGASHNLITGEKITYDANGNTSILPGGVTDTFAIVVNATTIKLASSSLDALNNTSIVITSPSGTHKITSSNVIKNIQGGGSVTISAASKDVLGSNTSFLTQFKRFDQIYINTGSYVKAFTVDTVSTNTNMTLFDAAGSTASASDYYYATQLALRPDGYSLHKPFDGGVDITAGTSPTSRIARQTRKYFRYQSGKGLQTSFAINFNPPKIVRDLIKATGTTATIDTQEQHNLRVNDVVIITGATVSTGTNYYNGTFTVTSVPNPFQFTYTMSGAPTDVRAGGFPTYVRQSWTDSFVRGGMFDDQNGFFYEFDGQNLYAVRRSSTKQLAGNVSLVRGSQVVNGESSSFTTQLTVGDRIVIRGQSYKVTEISSDIRCVVQPAYRGITATRVKATKTVDTKTPQSAWNIDKADGTGFTGYNLDLTKIQMAYMDYSWYGAGKIRYGFKDSIGHIRYFHEYIHNNKLDESYFRSGNLPARYEVENGPNSSTSPTLFHFGTSIIMDGTFDDDKAYQFTGQSRPFAFSAGGNSSISSSDASTFEVVTLDGVRVYVYAIPVSQVAAESVTVGNTFVEAAQNELPSDSYITQVLVSGSNSKIYLNYPATTADPTGGSEYGVIASATNFVAGESSSIELQRPIPLISVRLAPSVDSSLTGFLGERDIINRMQLRLAQASVTTNKPIEIFLIQNTLPSRVNFINAQSPSLSQVIQHSAGDTLLAGTTIYNAKIPAGSTSVPLDQLLEIGNSILGGDGIFPAGPDLLTLAAQLSDSTGVTFANPFTVAGNISWSESQA